MNNLNPSGVSALDFQIFSQKQTGKFNSGFLLKLILYTWFVLSLIILFSAVSAQTPNNGGGGGTFVVKQAGNVPWLIAGGGGGASGQCCGTGDGDGGPGLISNSGSTAGGNTGGAEGAGGTGGNGGAGGTINGAGGGAGFYGNGANGSGTGIPSDQAYGGYSFLNGGIGGIGVIYCGAQQQVYAGFGGGGGASHCCAASYINGGGGGGGGYSGGGGAAGSNNWGFGGGGGSYNIGTSQVNYNGSDATYGNNGDGAVIITWSGGTQTFTKLHNTLQYFTVPAGVTSINIVAKGAKGGNAAIWGGYNHQGGKGAYMSGDFAVTAGDVLIILVGESPESYSGTCGTPPCTTPTAFSVTGGGSFCSGGAGVAVGLNGSETNVNYQLLLNGSNTGSPVAGTGSSISFGNQTGLGTYTVFATSTSGSCTNSMSGSVSVSNSANNTISLSSAAGTDAQTACINTAITSITYTTTGATGASFSGLPTGVSGNWSANTVTISGSASVTGVFNYTVTLTGGCGNITATGSITINPVATVNAISDQLLCHNSSTAAVSFSSPTTGGTIVYNWTNDAPSIGLAASGTGNIASFTATNTTTAPVIATITVTPAFTNGGATCNGTARTFTITVNPIPTVDQPSSQVVCNNTATALLGFTGPVAGTKFSWTNNTPSIGLAASGTGDIASFTATNATTAPVTATITVTPSTGTITAYYIRPSGGNPWSVADNNNAMNAVFGAGNWTLSNFVAADPVAVFAGGTKFVYMDGSDFGANELNTFLTANLTRIQNWVSNGGALYLKAAPNVGGNINFGFGGVTCNYPNSSSSANAVVPGHPIFAGPFTPIATSYTGGAFAHASLSGGSFTNLMSGTAGSILGSLSWGSGSVMFGTGTGPFAQSPNPQAQNLLQNIISYVAGSVSAPVICTGPAKTLTITVNPTATINTVASQVLCNNASTTAVNFSSPTTGGTIVYNWTNNNTTIGLAASGSGDIASFTATNSGTAPITATITVTPAFTNAGITCNGTPISFTITVNPTATINTVADQVLCNETAVTAITFSSPATGGSIVYNWTNDAPSIGLAASGSGNIASFTATNAGTAPVTATIIATPAFTNNELTCNGTPVSFTITVNPTATINTIADQVLCNETSTAAVNFSSPTTGGTIVYNWTNNNTSIGLAASGSGDIASFTATNTGNAPVTATITVTPAFTNGGITCNGTPISFTITVNPTAIINEVGNQVLCNNSSATTVSFSSPTTGGSIVYNWTNDAPSIGLAASGTGDIASFTATNITNAPVTATITVTPAFSNGGITCNGTPISFTIIVNPTATIDPVANKVLCNNSPSNVINFSSPATGGTIVYNWTNNTPSIGLAASGTGDIASFTALNPTSVPVIATITVIPAFTNGGITCNGTPITFTITVNPEPTVDAVADQVVCDKRFTNAVNFSTPETGGEIVYNWTNSLPSIGLPASGTGNIAAFNATNDSNVPVTATISVIASFTGDGLTCTGPATTFTITVNPTLTVNPVTDQTVCNNAATTTINFNGSGGVGPTVTYSWINNTTSIGLAASGTGDIASFTATNSTNAPVTATIQVSATYTGGGISCTGLSTAFSIKVNPTATVNAVADQQVCKGATTAAVNFSSPTTGGTIVYHWSNNNTAIGLGAGGTGNIPVFTATNNTTTQISGTITVTPTYNSGGISCIGTPVSFTITVNPLPAVDPVTDQVICNNAGSTAVHFTGTIPGTVYNWTNNTPSIGLAASGTGDIPSFTALNATNAPVTATITVTPDYSIGGLNCTGAPVTFTITVNPSAIVDAVADQTVCLGTGTTVNFTGSIAGAVYNWSNDNPAIGLPATGSGNIYFIATNATTAPLTATVTVVPAYDNGGVTCNGTPITFTITVNPAATVDPVANQVICNNTATAAVNFSSATSGVVFNWTNSLPSIGLAASGTGNIPVFTAVNNTTAPVTALITVIASYTNGGVTCTGPASTFMITVNPTLTVDPVLNQTVCNSSPTAAVYFSGTGGNGTNVTYNWTNSSPSIGLPASGTGDIASFIATNATNTPVTATIQVTATYTGGGISCTGPAITFTITVNPLITMNAVASQTVCSGTTTAAVNFTSPNTGGTMVYNWSNSNTAIGLGASGLGNIPGFTATNTTTAPISGTITVTPTYSNGGVSCVGTPVTFTITVNPSPTVNTVSNQVLCNNTATAAVSFTCAVPGTIYNWTNSAPSIGLAASGAGAIASFTATNATNLPIVATITVTPSYTNGAVTCTGSAITFTITVNPTATVNAVANQTICAGTATTANFTGAVTGTVYNWTNSNVAIGLAASGSGNISFVTTNTTAVPVTATITVTPVYSNGGVTCSGTPINFTITVNPTPSVDPVANKVYCNNSAATAVAFTSTTSGVQYNWTNSLPSIGLAASGTGNLPAFTAINTGTTAVTATITVTPTFTGTAVVCTGAVRTFTITVNPTPAVNAITSQTVCSGSVITAVSFTGPVAGTVYNWTSSNINVGLAASGTGTVPAFISMNNSAIAITTTITVTPSYTNGGITCSGTPVSYTITVNPLPIVNFTGNPQRVCLTDSIVTLRVTPAGGTWTGKGVSGNTFSAVASGVGTQTLYYTVNNAYGCSTTAIMYIVASDCQERHNVFLNAIHIYPNPGSGLFNIKFNSDIYKEFSVDVIAATGQLIKTYHFANLIFGTVIPMDLRSLPNGLYHLEVYNSQEKASFKYIIAR